MVMMVMVMARPSRFLLPRLVALLLLLSLFLSHDTAARRITKSQSLIGEPSLGLSATHGNHGFFKLARRWDAERRDLREWDVECRRVHEFENKCKFVRENCRDEEVGFFDYLELYYCRFPDAPAIPFSIMAAWLVMLFTTIGIAASDFFCINLSTISNILGMSESMAGVTFLAFGNGSPDVFSTFAAMKINSGSLAVGELIGAASFIAAVVAGSMAIVHPFHVGRNSFVRDVSFFIVAVLFGIGFLADGLIQMWECAIMVIFYIFYVCFVVVWHWMEKARKSQRRRERMMREHFVAPEEEDLLVGEDEDGRMGTETEGLLGGSVRDFGALERGEDEDEDEDEGDGEREAYADLSNAMRISRPRTERSLTPVTPHSIRPSLVGALEFRAVLHHLEKTRNLSGRPIHLRRYSDDPLSVLSTAYSAPGSLIADSLSLHSSGDHPTPGAQAGRLRAVSVSNAAHPSSNWETLRPSNQPPTPDTDLTLASRDFSHYPLIDTSGTPTTPDLLALPAAQSHPNFSRSSPATSEPTTPLIHAVPRLLVPDNGNGSDTNLRVSESPRLLVSQPVSPPASIRLPPASSIDNVSLPTMSGPPQWRTLSWWPYRYLPPPQLLGAALFPTLRGWGDKSVIEKILALAATLPVFLLTITLPVVEGGSDTANEKHNSGASDTLIVVLEPESPASSASPTVAHNPVGPKEWNRWLICVQSMTAPVFMVFMFGYDPAEPRAVIKPMLYALIAGLLWLGALLATTNAESPPRWRYVLCFAGFAVSIGWISAIANEVVGVLKAFGVVLGISDAILGLTIFAVGNSLGDLVADITVARLGFPVMALSACFGGPMLNILLGIGLSGLYITLSRANHEAYEIEVSSTLVISAATLLVTLVLLLVAVPLNKWTMTRRIGWTLIGLWCVSTAINLVVEMTGIAGDLVGGHS